MRPLVLHSKSYRRVLLEHAWHFVRNFYVYSLLFVKALRNVSYFVLYVLFVPAKVYKLESAEVAPREVNLRDEYQKHQLPPRPFC